jgi:TPP-dependent pyruvate/acetoin dehydrogenase alpha subunit
MTPDIARSLLYSMRRIRCVEEMIAARYSEQKMRCPTHLSTGQEAVAAAVGAVLRRDDLAVSGHRAHAHYLAKGGDLPAMIAEIYGKATGCAGGHGGSMHLIDEAAGFMGSTAIVAGTVPVGVGLAYAMRLKRTEQVSCVFMGDAVAEAGVFFESVNLAVLKQLPVLFICENNLYSVYSPLGVRQPEGRSIHQMAAAMRLPSAHGDGNDVLAIYQMVEEGVRSIRAGGGPRFYEFATYRWREHCGPLYDNDVGYRSLAEFEEW